MACLFMSTFHANPSRHVYRKKWLVGVCLKKAFAARDFEEFCLSLKRSALTRKSSEIFRESELLWTLNSDAFCMCGGQKL